MPMFTKLNSNLVTASLFNMIISQHTQSDDIDGLDSSLVNKARVDGTLYGDQKIYVATDVGRSKDWLNDAEAGNLLKLERPTLPKVQSITLDQFRQIATTVDEYLSKQAWQNEGSFSQYTARILQWQSDTEAVYDNTTYNTFIGTNETKIGKQSQVVTLPTNSDPEKQARLRAQTIAQFMADLLVELKDTTRHYNDYKFLRARNAENLQIVWNAKFVNRITKLDLPTIFHKDSLGLKFEEDILPDRFFGTVQASGGTTLSDNKDIRSTIEIDYNEVEPNSEEYDPELHIFPGDLLPNNKAYGPKETYKHDPNIICKVMHKQSVPYMSAMEVNTSFFNARSLTTTYFATFGRNTLEHIKGYPFITIKAAEAKADVQAAKAK